MDSKGMTLLSNEYIHKILKTFNVRLASFDQLDLICDSQIFQNIQIFQKMDSVITNDEKTPIRCFGKATQRARVT